MDASSPPFQITLGCDLSFPPPPSPHLHQHRHHQHHHDRDRQDLNLSTDTNQSYSRTSNGQPTNKDQFLPRERQSCQQQLLPHHHHHLHHHHHHQTSLVTPLDGHATPQLSGSTCPSMYPASFLPLKDQSPSGSSSGSNRSSTVSSNSSGYSGSCGQLPPHLKQHHRLSGQSIESGISTLSSQYAPSPVVTSSHNSLDRNETGTNLVPHGKTSDPYQQGLKEAEALYSWLQEINQTDCYQLFLQSGYDKPTISRMTPEDLTAIGITAPSIRKKLTTEISKLQIPDGIPNYWPSSLGEWLHLLHLERYQDNLTKDGYHTLDGVLQVTWEDLEEIGIKKLGHQKKIILAIDKLKKIHSSKNLPQTSGDLFDFASPSSSSSSSSKNRKRSPLPCHKLIADQISAKNRTREQQQQQQQQQTTAAPPRKSPEIIHLSPAEVPKPEIVAIKVNRSWSAGQEEQERQCKYESFHGSPSRDFRSLFRGEEDLASPPSGEVFRSLHGTPTRFFEPPPSPAPDSSLPSPVRMRPPPQVAPKPANRSRRASGGATIGSSYDAESLTSCGSFNSASNTNINNINNINNIGNSRNSNNNGGGVNGSVLKRQNSCQGSILAQFSPTCGDSPLLFRPADAFHQTSPYDNLPPGDSSRWKRSAPPAPPKRTNSIKSDLNVASSCDSYHGKPPLGGRDRDKDCSSDANAKLPPLARGLSRNWQAQNKAPPSSSPANQTSSSSFSSSSSSTNTASFRSVSFDKSSSDCNTLPFANENVGTIKQKTPTSTANSDPSKRPPVKPKPKLSSGSLNASPSRQNSANDGDTSVHSDSVFDDIDSMFQGLAKELDEMLIG